MVVRSTTALCRVSSVIGAGAAVGFCVHRHNRRITSTAMGRMYLCARSAMVRGDCIHLRHPKIYNIP